MPNKTIHVIGCMSCPLLDVDHEYGDASCRHPDGPKSVDYILGFDKNGDMKGCPIYKGKVTITRR